MRKKPALNKKCRISTCLAEWIILAKPAIKKVLASKMGCNARLSGIKEISNA